MSSVGHGPFQVVVQAYITCFIMCNLEVQAVFKINVARFRRVMNMEQVYSKKKVKGSLTT